MYEQKWSLRPVVKNNVSLRHSSRPLLPGREPCTHAYIYPVLFVRASLFRRQRRHKKPARPGDRTWLHRPPLPCVPPDNTRTTRHPPTPPLTSDLCWSRPPFPRRFAPSRLDSETGAIEQPRKRKQVHRADSPTLTARHRSVAGCRTP